MKNSFMCIALLVSSALPAIAEVKWTVSERQDNGATFYVARARNEGSVPEKLGRYKLHEQDVPLSADAVALLQSGWQGPSPVKKVREATKPLQSKTLVQLYDGKTAFHAGFITLDRIGTEQEVRWDESRKVVVVASYCDFEGYELAPGASIQTEELVVRTGANPYEALEDWASLVAAHYRPKLWPDIPAGWLGWSWVDGFNVERYEDVVKRNARAVRERLPGAKVDFIWVSIGNLDERRPGNWLRWNHRLFPSGHEKLVNELGAQNFKLGLWCGAFWMNVDLLDAYGIPVEAVLHRDGKPIIVVNPQWGDSYILDPTHPKAKSYLTNVFSTYREWGVRYYMIDFINSIGDAVPGNYRTDGFYDRSLIKGPQTLREGLKVIRDAAGPDTYLLSSSGATMQGVGLVDGARIGYDYGEGRPMDGKGKGLYPGTFAINNPDFWMSHRRATNSWAASYFMHNRLYIADSGNVLTVDKPIPRTDAEISATIFGLNGGPLMLGDDVDRMDSGRLAMLRQQFPRMPESARPVDLFDFPEPGYVRSFHLPVKTGWDEWHLLAVFNYDKQPYDYTVDFARLGLDAQSGWVVWDHWAARYLGVKRDNFHVSVAPESVTLLRLSRRRDHPWPMSTDMHIRQGQAEISDCHWDATTKTLTFRATRPIGNSGSVYIRVPKDLAVANPAGLWLAKDTSDETLVLRCFTDFKDADMLEKKITFK